MTPASYVRRDWTRLVWGVVIALALLAGLWYAGTLTLRAARDDERRIVLAEGDSLQQLATARGDTLRRALDSLRRAVRQVDTVLVSRLRTVRDTAWLPDTILLTPTNRSAAVMTACRAQLDTLASDCERFRATATTALATADSLHRADSSTVHAQSIITAGIARSRDAALKQLAARGTLRAFERGVCVASLATNYFQWRTR
jgi:hypothetical protein